MASELSADAKILIQKYMFSLMALPAVVGGLLGFMAKTYLDSKAKDEALPYVRQAVEARTAAQTAAAEATRALEDVERARTSLRAADAIAKIGVEDTLTKLKDAVVNDTSLKRAVLDQLAKDYIRAGDTIGLQTRANTYIGADNGVGVIN